MAKASSESIVWTEGLILKTFGLNRILEGYPLLQEWIKIFEETPSVFSLKKPDTTH